MLKLSKFRALCCLMACLAAYTASKSCPQTAASRGAVSLNFSLRTFSFHSQRHRCSFLAPFQCHSQSSIDMGNGEGIPLCRMRWATSLEPEEAMGDGGLQPVWPSRSVAGQTASREEALSPWFFWGYQYPDANDIDYTPPTINRRIGAARLRGIVYELLRSARNLRPALEQ
jgi:hypothetical protein